MTKNSDPEKIGLDGAHVCELSPIMEQSDSLEDLPPSSTDDLTGEGIICSINTDVRIIVFTNLHCYGLMVDLRFDARVHTHTHTGIIVEQQTALGSPTHRYLQKDKSEFQLHLNKRV